MRIELDETVVEWSPEMAARITRPRAVKILAMIMEAREVIIQTHPEPETVRYCYNSEWITAMCVKDPEVIDPRGTLRFLQKIDALFAELGITDIPSGQFIGAGTIANAEPDFNETVEEEAERETTPDDNNGFSHPVYDGAEGEED